MKFSFLLIFCILFQSSIAQEIVGLELIVVPESSDKIYINEKVEFNSYIINNKQDRYFMPARNLTEYKKAFVEHDYSLFGPDDSEVLARKAKYSASSLSLKNITFISYTGTKLPDYFERSLKKGATVSFLDHMNKSKDYKRLKKLGYLVYPRNK